jgi:hypothetical protein
MVFLAALGIGWQRPPAEGIVRGVIAHYQKLKSISVKIIHHGDILSDEKDSTDTVSWLAPKRFEMVSNRDSIPKLFSDGKRLTTFIPQVAPIGEPLESDNGRMKSWESRGGIILSCLMRGQMASQWLHPERGIKVTFEYGTTLHWHDVEVSEIVETLSVRGANERISWYLSANHEHVVGTEVVSGPNSIWTQYSDEQENPDLPKTVGSVLKTS